MSDTPRTDSHQDKMEVEELDVELAKTYTFARQLERELAAANSKLSAVFQWINRNHPDGFIDSQSHLQNLERVTDLHHDRLDAAQREQAKWQALASNMEDGLLAIKEAIELVFWSTFDGNEQIAATAETLRHDVSQTMGDAFEKVTTALAAYEAAKSGSLPDPLAEAVKRMEAVPAFELQEYCGGFGQTFIVPKEQIDYIRARLIQAAKKPAASLDEPPGPA